MKDEVWLKKIKENLDDYSAPVPEAGWERLEEALDGRAVPSRRRVIPLRRWAVAAAALLVGAVSFVALRLTDGSLPDAPAHSLPAGLPAMAEAPVRAHPSPADVPLPALPRLAELPSEDAPAEALAVDTMAEERGKYPAEAPRREDSSAVAPAATRGKKRTGLPDMNRNLLALSDEPRTASGGWSVGLSVGNTGGFGSPSGDMLHVQQSAAAGPGYSDVDLSAASDGVLTIPQGQELVFQNGLPYLQRTVRRVISADHKQPVSVGFSFRKNLCKVFSVETGLVYTLLASDVFYEGDLEKTEQKLHYLGIPLRANWNFLDKKRFSLYVSAGGMVEKCVYGKVGHEKQTVDPLQWSVMASVGVQYHISPHVGIYVEPGLSYYFDDGSSVPTIRKDTPCNFTLQAGFRLSY